MRRYILTDQEREIINEYLKTGKRLENFKVLLHRCRNIQNVENDLMLIKEFLIKTAK